jgi:NAD(P)-dependent dehydrogenase (short-subunit alcohol dehydrogenase family)
MASAQGQTGFQIACELAEAGAQMVAARVRRERPDATDEDVEMAVRAWWSDRPGAPNGDAIGRVRPPLDS